MVSLVSRLSSSVCDRWICSLAACYVVTASRAGCIVGIPSGASLVDTLCLHVFMVVLMFYFPYRVTAAVVKPGLLSPHGTKRQTIDTVPI